MSNTARPNRRQTLGGLGALATAGLASRARAADASVMATLSAYMAGAAARPLPPAVVEKTKQMILDALAAMISGSQLSPGRAALSFARANPGERIATIPASNLRCGAIEAALVNGMLAHSDETDDSHPASSSHPGSSVVPSALATGERFGISGERFLRAVVLGYDVGPRVTMTLGRGAPMRTSHSIAGVFGSAAAAGSAAGLSAQQMRWLMSYAAQSASGITSWQRDSEHIEKSFDFAGMPARSGVTAALLVHAGATGLDDVFSGASNFFQAFQAQHDPGTMIDGLGERYEVTRTDVKKWTVGSPIQAPLDAVLAMLKKERIDADSITRVTVRVATSEATVADNRDIPDISLQHIVAVMLIDGNLTFRSAHDAPRMKDPAVLRLRAKVQLIADEDLEKLKPRRAAVVEIVLADGRTLTERVEAVRGTTFNPMTRDEVITKARDLIVPVLGEGKFMKLSRRVFALEDLKTLAELRPLLQTG